MFLNILTEKSSRTMYCINYLCLYVLNLRVFCWINFNKELGLSLIIRFTRVESHHSSHKIPQKIKSLYFFKL